MGTGAAFRLIAISTAVLVSYEAGAEQLCGRSFDSFETFYVAVRTERNQMRMDGPRDAMFIDAMGTTWRFTKQSHSAHPAVACVRLLRKGPPPEFERHFWCRGVGGRDACDEFIAGFAGSFEWK